MQNYKVLKTFRDDSQKPSKWYKTGDIVSFVAEVAARLVAAHVITPILDKIGSILNNLPQKPNAETATSDKNPKIERREVKPKEAK